MFDVWTFRQLWDENNVFVTLLQNRVGGLLFGVLYKISKSLKTAMTIEVPEHWVIMDILQVLHQCKWLFVFIIDQCLQHSTNEHFKNLDAE